MVGRMTLEYTARIRAGEAFRLRSRQPECRCLGVGTVPRNTPKDCQLDFPQFRQMSFFVPEFPVAYSARSVKKWHKSFPEGRLEA